MDAFVQFLRNAMCCIKDLDLLSDTFLYDASIVQKAFPQLPSPLNETTPLEVAISLSQFYAFWSVTRSGYNLITDSWSKLRYLRQQSPPSKSTTTPTTSSFPEAAVAADRLVRQSFAQSQTMAWRNLLIGWNVLPIGIAFFWLFANSWHVTSTNWIGGLQGVIHALTVMEVCLVPLLYYMLVNAQDWLVRASQFPKLAMLVQAGNLTSDDVTVEAYQAMTSWMPYWDDKDAHVTNTGDAEKRFQKEVERVRQSMEALLKEDTTTTKTATADGKNNSAKGEKEEKIIQTVRRNAANQLQSQAKTLTWEGYREYLYFVINFIAFYGYLLGVICYYTTEQDDEVWYVRNLKLGMSHASADWHGNFAGDLMWTIEPLIILGSPSLIRNLTMDPSATVDKASSSKVKSE